jgi:AcrR family transcriptional regulator
VIRPDATKDRLVRAAEELFAEHGVEAVSLREVGRAAGAGNIAAAQYHFGDRAGLIAAILEKHTPGISKHRHALLDDCETASAIDQRELVGALVRPMAAKLDDEDGGRHYLRVYAELVNRPSGLGVPLVEGSRNSLERWARLIEPSLGADGDVFQRRFLAVRITASELGRRARVRPHGDQRLFVEHLIDAVLGLLIAPSADITATLARRRSRRPGRSAFPSSDREL